VGDEGSFENNDFDQRQMFARNRTATLVDIEMEEFEDDYKIETYN
jgi:hypothetical protein